MTPAISLIAAPAILAGTIFTAPTLNQTDSRALVAAPSTMTIVETAAAAGRFDTLVAAVTAAGLDGVLDGPGPFTVFAPTDGAFAKVPASRINFLLDPANIDTLTAVLTFHVVADELNAADVLASEFMSTVNGQRAYVSLDNGIPMLDGATITYTDIQCSNGIIHVIDEVIFPELGNITQVAERAGAFSTLLTALDITNLDDALRGPGPFTVFAPTDDAFNALPPGVLDGLIQNPRALANVLGFHVTAGRMFASDVLAAGTLGMLNGDQTTITNTTNGVFIENAMITVTDIQAANGVIHVIDAVLVP